jgi:hypothetical protein
MGMDSPGFKIAWVFIAIALVFLGISVRDYLRTKGFVNPARRAWLTVSFILAAVGAILALMHS